MGIYDRDYMRRGGSSFALPANWTLRLIVALVVAWLLQGILTNWFRIDVVEWFGLSWRGLGHGRIWSLVTYAGLHGGAAHLFWNCLGLWFFGDLLERATDPRDILRFGLVAAMAGGVGHLVGALVAGWDVPVIGASGILSAVLAFGALRYPHVTVNLFFVLPVPMWLFALILFAGDVSGVLTGGHGPIAYGAHIGGALYGLVVHRFGVLPRVYLPRLPRFGKGQGQAARRPPATRRPPSPLERADHDQRHVDELLDKINREGIAALTAEEREFLNDASRRYR